MRVHFAPALPDCALPADRGRTGIPDPQGPCAYDMTTDHRYKHFFQRTASDGTLSDLEASRFTVFHHGGRVSLAADHVDRPGYRRLSSTLSAAMHRPASDDGGLGTSGTRSGGGSEGDQSLASIVASSATAHEKLAPPPRARVYGNGAEGDGGGSPKRAGLRLLRLTEAAGAASEQPPPSDVGAASADGMPRSASPGALGTPEEWSSAGNSEPSLHVGPRGEAGCRGAADPRAVATAAAEVHSAPANGRPGAQPAALRVGGASAREMLGGERQPQGRSSISDGSPWQLGQRTGRAAAAPAVAAKAFEADGHPWQMGYSDSDAAAPPGGGPAARGAAGRACAPALHAAAPHSKAGGARQGRELAAAAGSSRRGVAEQQQLSGNNSSQSGAGAGGSTGQGGEAVGRQSADLLLWAMQRSDDSSASKGGHGVGRGEPGSSTGGPVPQQRKRGAGAGAAASHARGHSRNGSDSGRGVGSSAHAGNSTCDRKDDSRERYGSQCTDSRGADGAGACGAEPWRGSQGPVHTDEARGDVLLSPGTTLRQTSADPSIPEAPAEAAQGVAAVSGAAMGVRPRHTAAAMPASQPASHARPHPTRHCRMHAAARRRRRVCGQPQLRP